MAEADPGLQASSLSISSDTLARTIAQVHTHPVEGDDVREQLPGSVRSENSSNVTVSSEANVPVNDILKTLNNIAVRFYSFEQQARVDRDRVSRLCDQFDSEFVNNKKGKTPKK